MAKMARKRNHLKTVTLTISTTPPVMGHLEKLVATGLYGKNPAEAAERLVARSIEDLLQNGTLPKLRRPR
jgi:hypothetical protein